MYIKKSLSILLLILASNAFALDNADIEGAAFRLSQQHDFLNHKEYVFLRDGQVAILSWYDFSDGTAGNPILERGGWRIENDNLVIQQEHSGNYYGEQWVYTDTYLNLTTEGIAPFNMNIKKANGTIISKHPQADGVLFKRSSPLGPTRFSKTKPNDKAYNFEHFKSMTIKRHPYKFVPN